MNTINCTHVRIQTPKGDNTEMHSIKKGYFSCNPG